MLTLAKITISLLLLVASASAQWLTFHGQNVNAAAPPAGLGFKSATTIWPGSLGNVAHQSSTFSVAVGDLMIVYVAWNAAGSGCGTNTLVPTSAAGNAFSLSSDGYYGPTYECGAWYYSRATVPSGTEQITITPNATLNQGGAVIALFTGTNASPIDSGHAAGVHFTSGPTFTSGNFTTGTADTVAFAVSFNYYQDAYTAGTCNGASATIPAGASNHGAAGGDGSIALEYVIFNNTQTTINCTMTGGATADAIIAVGVLK